MPMIFVSVKQLHHLSVGKVKVLFPYVIRYVFYAIVAIANFRKRPLCLPVLPFGYNRLFCYVVALVLLKRVVHGGYDGAVFPCLHHIKAWVEGSFIEQCKAKSMSNINALQ